MSLNERDLPPKRPGTKSILDCFLHCAPERRGEQIELELKAAEQCEGLIRAFGNSANTKTEVAPH